MIKEFIPPVISEILKKTPLEKYFGNSQPRFSNYHEALRTCTNDAYEEKELIEVILKKTKQFSANLNSDIIPIWDTTAFSILSILNPIITKNEKVITVLDFGGACGAHYFHLRSLVDKRLKLNWVVVETPTMVKYAKELENDELKFFDNFDEALDKLGNIDLLHTSGTLQCVENPNKYLSEILSMKPNWLLFNRLGLNKLDRDVITIHSSKLSWNGIGELPEGYSDKWIRYPFSFLSESNFLRTIEEDYSLVAKFDDRSGMIEVRGEQIVGYGLLCKHKAYS